MSSSGRVTRFGLRNFKAFHYLEDIELKPLTVLVGANSSGKSSIFQALLLLKQSSEAGRSSGLLKFDGEWTKLGSFANVVSDFDISRDIEFRFETTTDVPKMPWSGTGPSVQWVGLKSDIRFVFGANQDPTQVVLRRSSIRSHPLGSVENSNPVAIEYRSGGPLHENIYLSSFDPPAKIDKVSGVNVDKFWLESLDLVMQVGDKELKLPSVPIPVEVFGPTAALRHLIEQQLEYLGPIRADPRAFYPIEEDLRIGSRGEGTIPYLLKQQHDLVSYAPSPVDALRGAPLLEAVNDWLRRMKVTSHLTIDPIEPIAYTAAIQTSATKKSVNLSQVGFGISQLLPVLVMGLKGPPDAWLLFEQPESQLHPRLQAEIGDFFLATARAGKTVMVETHSDHLVNRLRRRIAEDETGELARMVQILFVHAGTPDDPSSYVEPLAVDESGMIVNCPPDFFSETADEAFAILNARRKRPAKGPR
ncbi:MAG: AAA family ATPase [Minicystis sp.]